MTLLITIFNFFICCRTVKVLTVNIISCMEPGIFLLGKKVPRSWLRLYDAGGMVGFIWSGAFRFYLIPVAGWGWARTSGGSLAPPPGYVYGNRQVIDWIRLQASETHKVQDTGLFCLFYLFQIFNKSKPSMKSQQKNT